MNCYIKSLEWICDGTSILKLESIDAYLRDLMSTERIMTDSGWIEISIVEESDIQYEQENNRIILSDNTNYWITYNEESNNIDTMSLSEVLVKNLDGKGMLNSRNYVGILDVGIKDFEIIVKSRKLNYERDFDFLRESISEFCDDLLSRSSSYFAEHFEKSDKYVADKINYADIAYLKNKLSPDNFPAWVDYFIHHAEHKYVEEEQNKSISDIDEIIPEAYMDALSGNQLVQTERVRGRAGQLGRAPQFIRSSEYRVTYDTNENRFVKFFVVFLKNICRTF